MGAPGQGRTKLSTTTTTTAFLNIFSYLKPVVDATCANYLRIVLEMPEFRLIFLYASGATTVKAPATRASGIDKRSEYW